MPWIDRSPCCLTELDHVRLLKLGGAHPPPALAQLLDAADLLPSREVPPDVVTMYTQMEVTELATGERQRLAICYPHDAEPERGFVSVLSPVGLALLGQRVGAVVTPHTPDGVARPLRIGSILFQPEATGDYVT